MHASPRSRSTRRNRARIVLLIVAVAISALSALVLAEWTSQRIHPGLISMKGNTALGFLLSGLGLVLLSRREVTGQSRLGVGLVAAIICVIGSITLAEYLLGWSAGIDQLVFRDYPGAASAPYPGRMAPATALSFILAGSAFFAASNFPRARLRLVTIAALALVLMIIGALIVAGYFTEALFHYRLWSYTGMAAHTAGGFLLLGIGLLAFVGKAGGISWSLGTPTTLGFALGILLMLLTAAGAFSYAKRMLETNKAVAHRQEVLRELQQCLAELTRLVSGERLYTIAGDEQLLKDRAQTKAAVGQHLSELRSLTSDNSRQRQHLDQLAPLLAQWDNWQDRVIVTRRTKGFAEAGRMITTGPGLKLATNILGIFREMQNEEYRLLAGDRQQAETASTATFLFLPLGVFVSLAVLLLGLGFLDAGIADRMDTEMALRKSEAQLHTVVQNLDEGVVVADLEGRLLQWNPAALKFHGYVGSDQDHRRFTELTDTFELSTLDGVSLSVEQWPLARILRGEDLRDLELRVRRIGSEDERVFSYNGNLVHDATGQPLMAIVTLSDITARKQAEELLRASEERYRELFESNPNPMWVYDLDTLSFLAVNAAAIRHYGYSQEEFLAMTLKEIRPPEDVSALLENIAEVRNGLDNLTQWHHRKKDGTSIEVEITSHELVWLGRRARLVLVNDITERKRAERELNQLNLELEERVQQRTADLQAANKELEAFSYSVSHDLRAPLRAVDGFSQALIEDYADQLPEEARRYLDTIRGGAQRMGALIDDLLTFSRLSRLPINKQPVNMTALVQDALEELTEQESGRKLDLRVVQLPACEGDPALLKQVWANLLSNAIKYTRKQPKALINVGFQRENGENAYFVSDNGSGFDMKYADKLFGVFQRLHRAEEFEGTGVGLAIVQRVVHRHGGRVWAQAAPDRGATFYFTMKNAKS